jgi:hypothetical protein
MTAIDDFLAAISSYATDHVATEIVEFAITSQGPTLNVGEFFRFRVKTTNAHVLDMTNVTSAALGTQFADVATESSSFGSIAVSGSFSLPAGTSHLSGFYRGRAKAITSGAKEIVNARINSWDASLDHILVDHTTFGTPEGKVVTSIVSN